MAVENERDGTAEHASQEQITTRARGQGNLVFPVQVTTSNIGDETRMIPTLLKAPKPINDKTPTHREKFYITDFFGRLDLKTFIATPCIPLALRLCTHIATTQPSL